MGIRFVFAVLVVVWAVLLAVFIVGMVSRRVRKIAALFREDVKASMLTVVGIAGTTFFLADSSVWFVALVANLSASIFVFVAAEVWEARGASREQFGPTGWLVVGAWGVAAGVVANVFALMLREPRSWAYLVSLALTVTGMAWGIITDPSWDDAAAQEA